MLRKIFGAKRDEVTGEWRKLHDTELHALYSSPDIIRNIKSRRLRWAGHVARMGEYRNAYRVLVVRLEGKRPLGRPRRRWEDNIKMDLREVGYDDIDWINLAQDRDQGLCEGGNEPPGSLKATQVKFRVRRAVLVQERDRSAIQSLTEYEWSVMNYCTTVRRLDFAKACASEIRPRNRSEASIGQGIVTNVCEGGVVMGQGGECVNLTSVQPPQLVSAGN
ncbi:hypothetical protein ANN_03030 [Periplaneta americana]|uniref:Uncharacterized protein n=1 Tax=Periplaneta americana TaxID=6978 RepID=A0ABQ8U0H0_PERAM|nr:hypothetical protein ANN_03030 [Periplaneta americana]